MTICQGVLGIGACPGTGMQIDPETESRRGPIVGFSGHQYV